MTPTLYLTRNALVHHGPRVEPGFERVHIDSHVTFALTLHDVATPAPACNVDGDATYRASRLRQPGIAALYQQRGVVDSDLRIRVAVSGLERGLE